MVVPSKPTPRNDNNFFENLWFKFFPYWPLAALLCILFLIPTFLYLRHKNKSYSVDALLVINTNDNNSKSYSNQPFQALNAYALQQNVDNEVLILQSRSLMQTVVNNLHLYAPIFEKGHFTKNSAYLYTPVYIEALHPEQLGKEENVFFKFDYASNAVQIGNRKYPLNEWVSFPYGTLRFTRNPTDIKATNKQFYFSLYNPAVMAEYLLPNLKVSAVNKLATIINLNYQAEVPEEAADVLNELVRVYMRQSITNENQLAANTLVFVDERLRDVARELDSIEHRIQQFRSAKGVIDLSEQGHIYLQNVSENNRSIADLNTQLAVLDQVERYINAPNSHNGIVPTTLGINDPVLSQLLQRLNELELQLSNLKSTTGGNNPLVVSVETEIQKIRPNIQNIVNNQRARLNASRNILTTTTNQFNSSISTIPEQERELLEISRQQAVKKDLYSFLLQRREEAALSNASSIADNRIIDWANASTAKESSNKMILLLGSIIGAFALTIAYIVYRESLNKSIQFRTELEKLTAIPVISEIVYAPYEKGLPFKTPVPVLEEQFHQLETTLNLFSGVAKGKKILITSSLPAEGKSFISSHLAVSLAMAQKRVILVDFHLKHPQLNNIFSLSGGKGVGNFLEGQLPLTSLIQKTAYNFLDVLPAGSSMQPPIALLVQNKLNELFTQLEKEYDYIIIDSPPVELASDAYLLSSFCDITLFVIRYNKTPKLMIRKMDDNSRLMQIHGLNIIFNGLKGRGILKQYYGLGFGYGKENVYKNKAYKVV